MIEVTKYDEKSYLAVMNIETFESYGLSADYIDGEKDSNEVATLLGEIMDIINESYGDFNSDVCGVGIVVDKDMDKVSISIGDEEPDIEVLHDYLDNLHDGYGDNNFKNVGKVEGTDYTQGIVAEFNDFEEVIEFSLNLITDKEDVFTLYEDEETKNTYYLLINKTNKLTSLMKEHINDDEDDDIAEAIEYEIGKNIFEEYEILRSCLEENGNLSNKKIGYFEDYCKLMINENAVDEIKKHFK